MTKQQFNVRLLPKTLRRIERFKEEAQCYSVAEAVERAFCVANMVLDIEKSGGMVVHPAAADSLNGAMVISVLNNNWLNEERSECDSSSSEPSSS